MENSVKEKIDREEGTAREELVQEVSKTEAETPDGKIESDREVDVEGFDFAEVESGTRNGDIVAPEEAIETKEEVVMSSDGTLVEEEAEKDSKAANGAAEKAEEVAASASASASPSAAAVLESESTPENLEETALPTSGTNVEESSGVEDSVPNENLGTNGSAGNQETTEIPRSIQNQQFVVAATPRTRGTWTNCCGLFELLRSNH